MAPQPTSKEQTPPAKRVRASYSTYITVLVGENDKQKSFMVHEGIITNHSKFFNAACNGNFKESKERTVKLPDVDPSMFESYLHWIYTSEVAVPASENMCEHETKYGTARFEELARLYVLGDQLDDKRLRNATIDSILRLSDEVSRYPGSAAIQIAYEKTPDSSTLRKLTLDFYLHHTDGDWMKKERHLLLQDFIFDIACRKQEKVASPSYSNRCDYHEHDEDTPRCD